MRPLILPRLLLALVTAQLTACELDPPVPTPEDTLQFLVTDTTQTLDNGPPPVLDCVPKPPPAALVHPGAFGDLRILPGGRALTPAGTELILGGFPIDVRLHPHLPRAYIANTGYAKRSLQVLDTQTGEIIQDLPRQEAFYGLALSENGKKLYASGGYAAQVEIYDLSEDGTLTGAAQVPIDQYPAGIALSHDGKRFWVGQFLSRNIQEFDTQTLQLLRTIPVAIQPYALLELPGRQELWVSSIADTRILAVDLQALDLQKNVTPEALDLGGMSVVNLVSSPQEDLIYAAIANGDRVVAIDTQNRAIVAVQPIGEASIAGPDQQPLPASSPAGIAYDPVHNRLFVTRAADNAVSVLNASDLSPLGAIPVSWYPTAVAVSKDGNGLVVLNGKGKGTGPLLAYAEDAESGKQMMRGTASLIDLSQLDLQKATAQVEQNVRRPDQVFPFQCDAPFPVPAKQGGATPIEHIVLIVKENKTYDTVLGDLGVGDGDPSLAMFGKKVTPNLHALALKYAHHDNFYDDSESSVQGHLWLTSSFVDDYMERTWFEDYRNHPGWDKDAVLPQGRPGFQTFFTHLMKHQVDFTMYGEVVGALDVLNGDPVASHVDTSFPGSFFNTDISDVDKAQYVADQLITQGKFPPFVYVLLPNDHTHGLAGGALSPASMVNDNDVGMGVLVDAITRSKYFATTAIFIVEDDPQQGADHVDYHRSICLVVSPYARPGYISHVHTSYPSLFKTFELILNLPPMNRYDALATAMWDVFQQTPVNYEPFTHLARTIPDIKNPGKTLGARISAHMDFSGPDKNPDLGDLLRWNALGQARAGSKIERIVRGELPPSAVENGDADGDGDDDAYDAAMSEMRRYLAKHPEIKHDMRKRRLRERD